MKDGSRKTAYNKKRTEVAKLLGFRVDTRIRDRKAYLKQWYAKNPEERRKSARKRYRKNKKRVLARLKRKTKKNPRVGRNTTKERKRLKEQYWTDPAKARQIARAKYWKDHKKTLLRAKQRRDRRKQARNARRRTKYWNTHTPIGSGRWRKPQPVINDKNETFNSTQQAGSIYGVTKDAIRISIKKGTTCRGRRWAYEKDGRPETWDRPLLSR